MLAWTEAGKELLQDEFDVIFALNKIEEARERIDKVPEQNPFTIKYETKMPATEDWEACTFVLDYGEKQKQLLIGW